MYSKRNNDYINLLLAQEKRIFRVSELALVWGINNRNTLNTQCKRYQQAGKLHRLIRGIYSIVPINRLHPFEIGAAVAGPLSYISTETVFELEGLISQSVRKITLVGKKQKEFEVNRVRYLCRYMALVKLVDRSGIIVRDGYEIADKNRAVNDMKLFNPSYYLDNRKV